MAIENYQCVRLLTARFSSTDNVTVGAIGCVIEVYSGGYCEVDFSDGDGITYAQIVTKADELEVAE